MKQIKVAAASPKMRVSDIEYNVKEIIRIIEDMKKQDVGIIVFPELALTGSTCRDIFAIHSLWNVVMNGLSYLTREMPLDIIAIIGTPIMDKGKLYNGAVVLAENKIKAVYIKENLTYSENKWFMPYTKEIKNIIINGESIPVNRICRNVASKFSFAVEIGNDMNKIISPSLVYAEQNVDAIFNPSAFPATKNYDEIKNKVNALSERIGASYILANAGPCESSDSCSYKGETIISSCGKVKVHKNEFSFETVAAIGVIDIEHPFYCDTDDAKINVSIKTMIRQANRAPFALAKEDTTSEEAFKAALQILDIQAYALARRMKQINASSVVLGVSGGLDSTLALLVCCRAADALKMPHSIVHGITMPGMGTTAKTKNIAMSMMENLGITVKTISIKKAAENHLVDIGHNGNPDVTFENAQARERTQVLMDYANMVGGLVVGTGDLSEEALGWCTYGGDHLSMYNVNGNIPKTVIRELITAYVLEKKNEVLKGLIEEILEMPISPELLPPTADGQIAQKTEESVGPYELHEFFVYRMVEKGESQSEILEAAKVAFPDYSEKELIHWLSFFIKRFYNNQFKRDCAANGPWVGFTDISPFTYKIPSDACLSTTFNH